MIFRSIILNIDAPFLVLNCTYSLLLLLLVAIKKPFSELFDFTNRQDQGAKSYETHTRQVMKENLTFERGDRDAFGGYGYSNITISFILPI